MGKKIFVTDCEGPISINDNAFELAGHFIEDGEIFFKIVSKYDDILADVIKKPGYNAGDTLKLIIPFLKAYGATNSNIKDYSKENVFLIPGAKDTLKFTNSIMPSFIVSTSYEHYIGALCDLIGFPIENTYSTKLDIDRYSLDAHDEKKLMEFRKIIIENPDTETLDKIFWEELEKMEIGKVMEEVKPVGGEAKKEAIEDIMGKFGYLASDIMYVGDSITDVQPFQYVKDNGGVAVSFNGNEYAIREAEIAIISDNTVIISVLADLFNRMGRDHVMEFVKSFGENPQSTLQNYYVDDDFKNKIYKAGKLKIEIINEDNRKKLIEDSSLFRKQVRGESIGGLG
ncbi:MAG: hypothetical protein ACXVHY_01540 [Methanobacterium sp.]